VKQRRRRKAPEVKEIEAVKVRSVIEELMDMWERQEEQAAVQARLEHHQAPVSGLDEGALVGTTDQGPSRRAPAVS
jgi:predicted transcriptional regulator